MTTTQFQHYKHNVENAINTCIEASLAAKSDPAVVEDLVKSHIKPLSGDENVLNIVLVKDKTDWRKSVNELVFRRTLLDLVDRLPETSEHFTRLFNGLDIVLSSAEQGYLDAVVPLTLIEELLDAHTINGCEQLFDYIEERKARLTVNMIPGRGKGLVLLRMCNELLRRLSKERNTVFCGRILMFLANSFPLGERSGVNLRGDFNTEEPVKYDSNEDVDADPNMSEDQKTFYKLFWSTRKYFTNPPIIFQKDAFDELRKGGDAILERFKQISNNEQAVSGDSGRATERTGAKRKNSDAMDIDSEENNDTAQKMLDEINRDYQFPRLLSSRKLLELEIEDTRFRRNVIVQFLILFQYLSGFTQEEKDATQKLLTSRGATKQSLVQPAYTLEGEELQWVDDTRKSMIDLLKQTKPHGELYTDIVQTILRHERNWIVWKASGCPPFEKPPAELPIETDTARASKRARLATISLNPYRFSYGNPETTAMYGQPQEQVTKVMQTRPKLPNPVEVIDATLAHLENDQDTSINERFDIASGAVFQATRLLFKSHASLIPKIYNIRKEVYKTVKDPSKKEEEGDSQSKTAIPVDDKTEQHLEAEVKVLRATKNLILGASNS
ncbi:THO complex, subunit THOC1 [Fennellomyces sp. T-0311]|nr:THO complex, subunit THOC1 [Fennellomyces sp. T-0311]